MADDVYVDCTCFDGVRFFGAEYTISQGISPGTGIIRCQPEGNISNWFGFLTLACGSDFVRVPIVMQQPKGVASTGGQEVIFGFQDTRYFWQFGEINGHYNKRLPNGDVDPETEKTPQQLAMLLCQQIKPLTGFDISILPNDARPEVEWDGANPASELANLCDQLNCVPNWWVDGTITVCQKNQGDLLDGSVLSESRTLNFSLKPKPDKIKLLGAPALFQVRLPLEAVGLDIDGTWQLIDDLSYRPTNGWEYEDASMENVSEDDNYMPDGSKVSARQLALHSVFRSFRVKDDLREVFEPLFSAIGGVMPSGNYNIQRKHILPLRATLSEEYTDGDGSKKPKPAYAGGVYWHEGKDDYSNTQPDTKYDYRVGIDPHHGIVHTSNYVVKLAGDGSQSEPDLWLYVAVTLQDPENRIPLRWEKELILGGDLLGSGSKIINREDVQFRAVVNYSPSTSSPLTIANVITNTTGSTGVVAMADYYLNAAAQEYNRPDSATDQIPWIFTGYKIDGAIQQITWRCDCPAPGATTIVSRGTQHDITTPTFKERREREARSEREKLSRHVKESKRIHR